MHGFFNTAVSTQDFRERRKPGRSLARRIQTRVHLHMSLFLTLLVRQDGLQKLFKSVQICSRGTGMCTSDGCESLIYFTGLFSNHYRTFNFWFASLYFVNISILVCTRRIVCTICD